MLGLLWASGCGASSSDLHGLELALGAASSLGLVTSLAMDAISAPTACAQVVAGCTSFPCSGEVSITLGADCPLPLGGVASGTVDVSGSWSSADSATLSTTFVQVAAGGRTEVVVAAHDLTVDRSTTSVTVKYVGQNVSVVGASTLTNQSSWTVVSDPTAGLTVSGTNQNVGGAAVDQLSVSSVVIAPACAANPSSGSATIQHVSTFSIVQDSVSFHSACDGSADVNGKPVAFQFLQ